jgi:hypothetical protein
MSAYSNHDWFDTPEACEDTYEFPSVRLYDGLAIDADRPYTPPPTSDEVNAMFEAHLREQLEQVKTLLDNSMTATAKMVVCKMLRELA